MRLVESKFVGSLERLLYLYAAARETKRAHSGKFEQQCLYQFSLERRWAVLVERFQKPNDQFVSNKGKNGKNPHFLVTLVEFFGKIFCFSKPNLLNSVESILSFQIAKDDNVLSVKPFRSRLKY
jgi:hypothetical protein